MTQTKEIGNKEQKELEDVKNKYINFNKNVIL